VLNPPSPTTAEVNPPVIRSTCGHDSCRVPASSPPLGAPAPQSASSSISSMSLAAALAPQPQQKNLNLCPIDLSRFQF
jgi:hypothetical protein